ncbi:MAG TPA: serine hydrolase [Candidatus Saccharimonadales bacterium]|nr:serine hydrolase [Candidatus Saccharimonadales bacterium]
MRRFSFKQKFTACLAIIVILLVYLYLRPVPVVTAVSTLPIPPKTAGVALSWPVGGQAALGAQGYGLLAEHNDTTPLPIASVAKVITALAVLQQKPLTPGSQGPTITLDNTDVDYFNYYYKNDGSVSQVQAGEKITEYQALEAMLIPSSNNMADSLARWAFGSIDNYLTYANHMVQNMGLTRTTVGSTNGFADKTDSTAGDVVDLGLKAMQNPVIAQIVAQPTATIPVEGTVQNVNYLLGSDGVVGIKTGNTDKAGGCYLFASQQQILGQKTILIGAILGAKDLASAISAAQPMIAGAISGFEKVKIASQNQSVGYYKAPWGSTAQLKPSRDLSLIAWKGADIKVTDNFAPARTPQSAGTHLGSIKVQNGQKSLSVPLVLTQKLSSPSWWWRITRH